MTSRESSRFIPDHLKPTSNWTADDRFRFGARQHLWVLAAELGGCLNQNETMSYTSNLDNRDLSMAEIINYVKSIIKHLDDITNGGHPYMKNLDGDSDVMKKTRDESKQVWDKLRPKLDKIVKEEETRLTKA